MPTSTNRTKWPVTGGAVGFQPGWFSGHKTALLYVNLGLGTEPLNMSHNMIPVFSISGPSNNMYPGSICLLQVPLPANVSVNVGDNATIQVVEIAQHGAALYSVSGLPLPPVRFGNFLTEKSSASTSRLRSRTTLPRLTKRTASILRAPMPTSPSTPSSPRPV